MILGVKSMSKCEMCGSEKNVSLEPTRSQLLFGGFRAKMMEYRCEECEAKVVAWIKSLIVTMR